MTLLYEAALSTHPEEQIPENHRSEASPRSGSSPRNDFEMSVLVDDPERKGESLWVAMDEAEHRRGGVKDNSVILATDLLTKTAPEGPCPTQWDQGSMVRAGRRGNQGSPSRNATGGVARDASRGASHQSGTGIATEERRSGHDANAHGPEHVPRNFAEAGASKTL